MADWSETATATALNFLKVDLGITTATVYDSRLTAILNSSINAIEREGVSTLSDDADDIQLVVMYAGWIWRRRDSGEGMPRMLRWSLNNRIMSEKASEEE